MTAMMRAGSLRGFSDLVGRLGGDASALLARHGLDSDLLRDEDALLPARGVIGLLETAARRLNCPDFGLQLASAQDASTLGPLALALQSAATVGEGLEYTARYLFTHSTASTFTIIAPDEGEEDVAELRYETLLPRPPPARQSWDLGLGLAHRMFRLGLGEAYRPRGVRLPHAPLAPASTYFRYFGTEVRFEQPVASLLIDRALLSRPTPGANPLLRQVAATYLDSHFAAPEQDTRARARLVLARTLGRSGAGLEQVAERLGLHPRTLQRHLRQSGATFESLRDEVRREAALRYIVTTRMPLAQVSGLLGLSEQSALTRSCRRWFGASPIALRRRPQLRA